MLCERERESVCVCVCVCGGEGLVVAREAMRGFDVIHVNFVCV